MGNKPRIGGLDVETYFAALEAATVTRVENRAWLRRNRGMRNHEPDSAY